MKKSNQFVDKNNLDKDSIQHSNSSAIIIDGSISASKSRPKFSETFLQKEKPKKVSLKKQRKANKKKACKTEQQQLPIFRSCIRIRIEGYNQNRLIAAFMKEKIKINTIQKKSQKLMDIVIDGKNKQKAIALIQKLCYNYSVVEVSGTKPALKWLFARIGIFVGAAIFLVFAFFSSSYVWRIDISGNDKIDDLTIVRKLNEMDIAIAKSTQFDTFLAAQAINELDGIVESTVEIVGTTVKVRVIEAKDFIPPEGDNTVGDIISMFDAEVTKITVSSGTAKVGIGDRIPKGSVLISRESLNSNGEVTGEVRARGSVFGKVIFSDTAFISTTVEEVVRTGNEYQTTSLSLWKLGVLGKNKNKFASYQSVTTESYAFYNTFLPIKVTQTTYYEVEKKLVEKPIEELVNNYKRQKLIDLVINAGGNEISTTITKDEISKGLYRVHLYMEAEMHISQFSQ